MAFAIFYNSEDMTRLSNAITTAVQALPKADRDLAAAYWSNGLSGWATAPPCPTAWAGGDAGCRMSVVSGTFKGSPLALQPFIDLLWRIWTVMPAGDAKGQFDAIIGDMQAGNGAKEPWP